MINRSQPSGELDQMVGEDSGAVVLELPAGPDCQAAILTLEQWTSSVIFEGC